MLEYRLHRCRLAMTAMVFDPARGARSTVVVAEKRTLQWRGRTPEPVSMGCD
jgi:hypothetical protein